MVKNVQIVLKVKDLKDESGNNLIFKIPFEQLVLMLIKSVHAMANDHENPIRLYASNANTALALLVNALGDVVEEPERVSKKVLKKGEKEDILKSWSVKYRTKTQKVATKSGNRKKSVVGRRPSDEVLLDFQENGFTHKKVAKLYEVANSTVSKWYSKIRKGGAW